MRIASPLSGEAMPGQGVRLELETAATLQAAIAGANGEQNWLATIIPPQQLATPLRPFQRYAELELTHLPFSFSAATRDTVLIGEDGGIGAILWLAEQLPTPPKLVLIGCRGAPPFKLQPSRVLTPGLPPATIGAVPSLDERGIASRIACTDGLPGCYEGEVSHLLEHWLAANPDERPNVFAAGPFGIEQRLNKALAGRQQSLATRLFA
ncbi:hypothetical protein CAI21_00685 [Alkalilimnicola ehrlichii]|uniref:Uncharacterized protein n=1 Tax=Alkalilimnicola ehrlichii TaxID=351052 RepID=A0A3E0X4P9_9GAMM|nr:hypothetical protein CAI21_00685 [Alkalilimnicola ehrlichii]RFA39516.1 hypothetical protein CAL65_01725 [Alkalilimnicola ehrlichii]